MFKMIYHVSGSIKMVCGQILNKRYEILTTYWKLP